MQANYDTNFSRAYAEHKRLLVNIKQAVETLFLNNCTESLLQLHTTIEHIFINGIRIFKPDVISFKNLLNLYRSNKFFFCVANSGLLVVHRGSKLAESVDDNFHCKPS